MKAIFEQITGALISAALLIVAGIFAYRYFKKEASENLPSLDKVASSTKEIIYGVPSVVASWARGESSAGYITSAQQAELARQALKQKRLLAAGA